MTAVLPPNPSLENLRKQAKTLQKAWRAGDARALSRIRAAHPQFTARSDQELREARAKLTDCQLVLARESGFASWPQLKVALEAAGQNPADQFVEIACLCYDDPHYDHRSFHARAHEMLQGNPQIAGMNIWAAAAAGNTEAVRGFLDANPQLVNRAGPHGWSPLICACYSRVRPVDPTHSTFEVAKLLLDRGADPNASTLKGNADDRLDQTARRFTALTGMFGAGSTGLANQPPHPRWRELAELLLERGADPADEEAILTNPSACLEMLLRHGLKRDAPARRMVNEGGQPNGDMTLMGRALSFAARKGDVALVRLLLEHGAQAGERVDGKTPWQRAMEFGHLEVARLIEQAGAPTAVLSDVERFVSLCLAGDERDARALLARIPGLMEQAPKNMVQRAVGTERLAAVRLALDLGFDPNSVEDNAAIHQAGTLARNEDILRLLLDRGASLSLRDPWYDGTGIGWADFFEFTDLRDRLLNEPGICLFDALDYDRLDRVPDILARDPEALERPFAGCLSHEPRAEDWQTPLVRMVDRGKTEAVRVLLAYGAHTSARHPDGRPLVDVAREKGFHEIAGMLEKSNAGR